MIIWPSPELNFVSDVLGLSLKPTQSNIEAHSLPFGDQINWEEFIRLATYHGVAGLLLYWMKKLKLESSLPRDVHRSLHGIHKSQAHFLGDHQEIIRKILMRFHQSRIEVILLKGAQLGHIDYPRFSLRPMGDIDLLVKGSDQLRVIKLLLEMGFNLYETGGTCNRFFSKGVPKGKKRETHKPVFVEVHSNLQVPVRLNRSFIVDMDEFWNGGQGKSINGFPFLQLCPTHNLIYLCSHLAEHHFSRMIWAYDVALLIQRHGEEIDWEKLEELCARMRIRSPLYHSLRLCRELFGIPISERVLRNLSTPWWRKRIGHFVIRRNLLFPEQYQAGWFDQFFIKTFLVDSWAEAMLWFLFPTREWMKKQYSLRGTREIYPYYLLHPILYVIKSLRTPIK
jgi:hypothetical protein